MPSLLDIARSYTAAGYSVVPVRLDGSKAPSVKWREFEERVATDAELVRWFDRASNGIALVHGSVSGVSEVLDFDEPAAWEEFSDLCDDHGFGELIARCVQVATPTGGHHLYYRYQQEQEKPEGNLKLARTTEGGTRIETRGEGGYTLAPGCPAAAHPSGNLYRKRAGSFNNVPVFAPEERNALLAMARACNRRAEEVARGQVGGPHGATSSSIPAGEDSPGNDFNARASQAEVLELLLRHGWQEVGRRGDAIDLRRPGKSDGLSATLGYVAPGIFFPFSSNAGPFDAERAYAPFSVYGLLEHGGDFAQAARALGARGFGKPLVESVKPQFGTSRSAFNKTARELPRIVLTGKQLPEKSDEAVTALRQANHPPVVFVKAGQLVRVGCDAEGRIFAQPLTLDSLRGILARSATWWTEGKTLDKPVTPPEDVIRDILSRPELWEGIPLLDAIVTAPVLTRGGELVTTPGYLASARLFYHQAEALDFGDTTPTAGNLAAARRLLLDQLLEGFPFKDHASKAHAIALALLPIVRLTIHGATPFHLVRASTPGTGKSLLVETLTSIVVPGGASARPCPGSERDLDEEMRKAITTALMRGTGHVWLDNIKRHLDSPSLALAITQSYWSDRALGGNVEVNLPVRCVWVGTGNNPTLSDELHRRTVFISLDANMERPWDRERFLIEDLKGFVSEKRGELVGALLTLVRAWLESDCPLWKGKRLGSFDNWCRVIGGILDTAGIEGFLTNRDATDQADPDRVRWASFLATWHQEKGETPCGVGDIAAIAVESDIILDDTTKERQRLGYRLRAHLDRVFDNLRLELAPANKDSKTARYRVIKAEGLFQEEGPSSNSTGALPKNTGALPKNTGALPKSQKAPVQKEDPSPSTEEPFTGTYGDLRGLLHTRREKNNGTEFRAGAQEKAPVSPRSPRKKEEEEYIEEETLAPLEAPRPSPPRSQPSKAAPRSPEELAVYSDCANAFASGKLRKVAAERAASWSRLVDSAMLLQKEHKSQWSFTEEGGKIFDQMMDIAHWWVGVRGAN